MYKLLNIIVALLFLAFQTGQSYAGSSTANATAGTGDYVYSVITDAGGHFIGRFGLCDGTAAASCATVTAGAVSTSITGAIPAGTNVIGHVITDTTSTTAVTQATAANLNATIVGTGTFAVQAAQSGTWNIGTVTTVTGVTTVSTLTSITNPVAVTESGTWNITNISGTISLPTGAATSANQTNASQKTQIVDGSGNVIASTSNNLNVQCANCSGSGASAVDAATFTAGTSVFAPSGGQFTSGGATACVTAHQCVVGMTAARAFLTDTSSINGTTTLAGNGTTGAGSIRVTIASDNTAFSVNAVESGTWNINNVSGTISLPTGAATSSLQPTNAAQGSSTSGQTGPMVQGAVTTAAPTYTTAQTSPLSLDTAGNLRVVGTGIAQGSTTSGQTGSLVLGAVTTSAPTYTTAQSSPLSLDTAGNLRVNVVAGGGSGGTSIADAGTFTAGTTVFTPMGGQFTSGGATACVTGHACWVGMTAARAVLTDMSSVNGTATLTGNGTTGAGSQRVTIASDNTAFTVNAAQSGTWNITNVSGTVSLPTGAATSALQATATDAATFTAGTSIFAPMGAQFTSGGATACVTGHECTLGMTAARGLLTDVSSVNGVTVLTGTGATGTGAQRVTVATDQATNAGAALVKGGVGVVNGGNFFQAVAASQTATVLQQTTGAAGDYLSHCDIYPASTSPGVVTVFDNTNTAANSVILFAGGATSLSNLAPIPVPVGAVSVSGAWKVTTGASVSVVCYGRFS